MSERDMEITLRVFIALAFRLLFIWFAMLIWNNILAAKFSMPTLDFLEAMGIVFIGQVVSGTTYSDKNLQEMLK